MATKTGVKKPYYIDLTAGATKRRIEVLGRYVQIADASSASAKISVAVDESFDECFENLKKDGKIFEGQGFKCIYVSFDAQPGEWVRLVVSDGPEDYKVDNPSQGTIDAIASPVDVSGIADPVVIRGGSTRSHGQKSVNTSATEIIAANADRTSYAVLNPSASVVLYIGSDNTVTSSNGWPLQPGQSFTGIDKGGVWGVFASSSANVPWIEAEA